MKTSEAGLKFIRQEEGCEKWDPVRKLYFPYRDPIGKWTIGVGHLVRADEDFKMGLTEERVLQLLAGDVLKCDVAIDGIGRGLTQNQHDALSSWLFNVGTGWASPERSSVARAIVNGEMSAVPGLLMLYDMADGKHQPWLAARRRREGALWNLPDTAPQNEIEELSLRVVALQFGDIDLAREADDQALEVVHDLSGDEENTPVFVSKRSNPPNT